MSGVVQKIKQRDCRLKCLYFIKYIYQIFTLHVYCLLKKKINYGDEYTLIQYCLYKKHYNNNVWPDNYSTSKFG